MQDWGVTIMDKRRVRRMAEDHPTDIGRFLAVQRQPNATAIKTTPKTPIDAMKKA
jgi:hypothetical protein